MRWIMQCPKTWNLKAFPMVSRILSIIFFPSFHFSFISFNHQDLFGFFEDSCRIPYGSVPNDDRNPTSASFDPVPYLKTNLYWDHAIWSFPQIYSFKEMNIFSFTELFPQSLCVLRCVRLCDQTERAMWALNALLRLKSALPTSQHAFALRLASPVILSAVPSFQIWAPNPRWATFCDIVRTDTYAWRHGKYFTPETVSAPLWLDSATASSTWHRAPGDLPLISIRVEWSLSNRGAIVPQVICAIQQNLQVIMLEVFDYSSAK